MIAVTGMHAMASHAYIHAHVYPPVLTASLKTWSVPFGQCSPDPSEVRMPAGWEMTFHTPCVS